MNWCWRKILVMPVLTCFFSTSISDNTKFSEMKPGERTKAYKISSVKNFCREKGPIEHEDMATRTHSISFWTEQNFRFSVLPNPIQTFKLLNISSQTVAFKLKTTSPDIFRVRPLFKKTLLWVFFFCEKETEAMIFISYLTGATKHWLSWSGKICQGWLSCKTYKYGIINILGWYHGDPIRQPGKREVPDICGGSISFQYTMSISFLYTMSIYFFLT